MNLMRRLSWLVFGLVALVAPPAIADDYLVYSEGGIPKDSTIWIWCAEDPSSQGLCQFFSERFNQCDNPEGSRHLNVPSNEWAGFGVFYVDDQAPPQNTLREDLSAFASGEIRFFARSASHDIEAGFQCDEDGVGGADPVGHVILDVLTTYGAGPSADWQEIVIPVADFYGGADLTTCLQNVSASFTTTGAAIPTLFQVDNVRWRTANSFAGASNVTVSGRQLMVDGKPFVVNGVAYSPHSIGENYTGGFRDRPDLYADDFAAIAAAGANAVRTYSTFMTTTMLDEAWANGLYVIPTFGVDTVQIQCDAGRAQQKDRLEEVIQQWKDHPAILLWMLGNEIETGLSVPELCDTGTCSVSAASCSTEGDCTSGFCSFDTGTACDPTAMPTTCPQTPVAQTCIPETCSKGWYPYLEELAAAAAVADPSHPTGTSNADVGNIGLASCSDDAALASLDLWGANLYRGCTFSTAFDSYRLKSNKPMLITEFGSDAWDSTGGGGGGAEDQLMQDTCVASLLTEARDALAVADPVDGVSTGQVLFAWMDEWWKASNCPDTYWDKHDTCEGWTQPAYPDPSIQEEWWGIATMQTFCTDMATPCTTDDDCPGAPGSCSIAGTTCRVDSECPGSCSFTTTQACTVDSDCPGLCSGNPPTSCANDGDCSGPQICIFGNERCVYEACNQSICNEVLNPSLRVGRTAYDTVAASYQPGAVSNHSVASFDHVSGNTDLTFNPGPGSADTTLYYGPFSALSTYGYSGSVTGLGVTGSSTVTLPGGELFWVLVGQNGPEACYGKDSACNDRPCFPDGIACTKAQAANANCSTSQCP